MIHPGTFKRLLDRSCCCGGQTAGKYLAASAAGGSGVVVWDVGTGEAYYPAYGGLPASGQAIAWAKVGNATHLAIVRPGYNTLIFEADPPHFTLIDTHSTLSAATRGNYIEYSLDGNYFVERVAVRSLTVRRTSDYAVVAQGLAGTNFAISPDSRKIAVYDYQHPENGLTVYNLDSGAPIVTAIEPVWWILDYNSRPIWLSDSFIALGAKMVGSHPNTKHELSLLHVAEGTYQIGKVRVPYLGFPYPYPDWVSSWNVYPRIGGGTFHIACYYGSEWFDFGLTTGLAEVTGPTRIDGLGAQGFSCSGAEPYLFLPKSDGGYIAVTGTSTVIADSGWGGIRYFEVDADRVWADEEGRGPGDDSKWYLVGSYRRGSTTAPYLGYQTISSVRGRAAFSGNLGIGPTAVKKAFVQDTKTGSIIFDVNLDGSSHAVALSPFIPKPQAAP